MSAGITALALAFPPTIRTNQYWHRVHPELVRTAADRALAHLWRDEGGTTRFERTMRPYLADPFKGACERRVLAPGETSLELEERAVRRVLDGARLTVSDLDLVLVASLRPDTHAVGNAAFLARRLELRCPAVSMETACSGSVFGLDLASTLVRAGRHRRVLVVTSCTYSRDIEETDTLAWFLADGAGAFVVESQPEGTGWLSGRAIPTPETCGAFVVEPKVGPGGGGSVHMRMRPGGTATRSLAESSEPYLETCCRGALDRAGLSVSDVDFFIFNTPTAWYAEFGANVLGVDRSRTISTYPVYTNIGPALMPANLYHAAASGRIQTGDRILLYSVGSASTAMAVVMRWGKVALGPAPAPATSGEIV